MKSGLPREKRGYAVSPAIGPVPAIFVPRSPGQASALAQVRRALAGALCLALRWAGRRLRLRAAAGRGPRRTGR